METHLDFYGTGEATCGIELEGNDDRVTDRKADVTCYGCVKSSE
jgi:hypothetical protein